MRPAQQTNVWRIGRAAFGKRLHVIELDKPSRRTAPAICGDEGALPALPNVRRSAHSGRQVASARVGTDGAGLPFRSVDASCRGRPRKARPRSLASAAMRARTMRTDVNRRGRSPEAALETGQQNNEVLPRKSSLHHQSLQSVSPVWANRLWWANRRRLRARTSERCSPADIRPCASPFDSTWRHLEVARTDCAARNIHSATSPCAN